MSRGLDLRIASPPQVVCALVESLIVMGSFVLALAIRLGDYSLTQIAGLPLDLAVLNHILARVWNRRSRR